MNRRGVVVLIIAAMFVALVSVAMAQSDKPREPDVSSGNTFTYQGQLRQGAATVNGSCDMAFWLYDSPSGGNLIGSPITTTLSVNNGLFTAGLNFVGDAFRGEARWLDIRLRCPAGSGSYTTLTPRQSLTPAPYALAFGAPGSVYGYLVSGGSSGPYYPTLGFNTYGSSYLAGVNGYGGIFQFQDSTGKLIYYTGSNAVTGLAHVNTTRVAIDKDGQVGIGTVDPVTLLHVKGNTTTSGNNTAYFENPAIGSHASAIHYGTTGDWYIRSAAAGGKVVIQDTGGNVGVGTANPLAKLDVNGGIRGTSLTSPADLFVNATGRIALRTTPSGGYAERMTITSNGNVGVSTTSPSARLTVRGPDASGATVAFRVENSNGTSGLVVNDDATVGVYLPNLYSTNHLCWSFISSAQGHQLRNCGSAAEYVPTIDSGFGYPKTADLVSIVPALENPYDDEHTPFVVEKSSEPCDDNLLGFILDPESGADGEKKNDHYLPLAIYGYFPAKVTLENGAIQRGDPLTSSSTPGYAMKATQACKTIGYALEDASADGTIQVFANYGESAASEVASLREQVQELQEQNAALDARLTALEQSMSGQAPAQNLPRQGVLLFGALFAVVGIVVVQRAYKRGA